MIIFLRYYKQVFNGLPVENFLDISAIHCLHPDHFNDGSSTTAATTNGWITIQCVVIVAGH